MHIGIDLHNSNRCLQSIVLEQSSLVLALYTCFWVDKYLLVDVQSQETHHNYQGFLKEAKHFTTLYRLYNFSYQIF